MYFRNREERSVIMPSLGMFVSYGFGGEGKEEKGLKNNYESILFFKPFSSFLSSLKPLLTNTP